MTVVPLSPAAQVAREAFVSRQRNMTEQERSDYQLTVVRELRQTFSVQELAAITELSTDEVQLVLHQ